MVEGLGPYRNLSTLPISLTASASPARDSLGGALAHWLAQDTSLEPLALPLLENKNRAVRTPTQNSRAPPVPHAGPAPFASRSVWNTSSRGKLDIRRKNTLIACPYHRNLLSFQLARVWKIRLAMSRRRSRSWTKTATYRPSAIYHRTPSLTHTTKKLKNTLQSPRTRAKRNRKRKITLTFRRAIARCPKPPLFTYVNLTGKGPHTTRRAGRTVNRIRMYRLKTRTLRSATTTCRYGTIATLLAYLVTRGQSIPGTETQILSPLVSNVSRSPSPSSTALPRTSPTETQGTHVDA